MRDHPSAHAHEKRCLIATLMPHHALCSPLSGMPHSTAETPLQLWALGGWLEVPPLPRSWHSCCPTCLMSNGSEREERTHAQPIHIDGNLHAPCLCTCPAVPHIRAAVLVPAGRVRGRRHALQPRAVVQRVHGSHSRWVQAAGGVTPPLHRQRHYKTFFHRGRRLSSWG